MASITEVVDWETAPQANSAHHPAGPTGREATRVSLSFREMQAAIARWRDSLDAQYSAIGHGHAQLHNRSHAISSASDHTATNWRLFYSNGSGNVAELGLGAADEVLTSNGAAAAPSMQAIAAVPAGAMFTWPTSTVPDGYFERDGTAKNMAVYEDLYDVLGNNYGLNAGTSFTAAADDIITATAHGLVQDDIVEVTTSAADLPAGLTIDTKYYVLFLSVNTFSVSLTLGGAAVNITDAGTGTHLFHDEYLIPDSRGYFPRYWDHGAGVDPDAAGRDDRGDGTTGDNVGTKQADEFKSHLHSQSGTSSTQHTNAAGTASPNAGAANTGSTGGNETRGINIYEMPIIKY